MLRNVTDLFLWCLFPHIIFIVWYTAPAIFAVLPYGEVCITCFFLFILVRAYVPVRGAFALSQRIHKISTFYFLQTFSRPVFHLVFFLFILDLFSPCAPFYFFSSSFLFTHFLYRLPPVYTFFSFSPPPFSDFLRCSRIGALCFPFVVGGTANRAPLAPYGLFTNFKRPYRPRPASGPGSPSAAR